MNCIYMNFFNNFEPRSLREWVVWNWNKLLYKLGELRYVNIDIRQKSVFDGVGIKIHTDLAHSMNQMPWYQYSSYPDDPSLVHFEALVTYDYDDGWLKEMKA